MRERTPLTSSVGGAILVSLGLALALGVAVGALIAIARDAPALELVLMAAVATLYSASIGVPAMLGFRYWRPRFVGRSRRATMLLYIAIILVATLVGSLFARVVMLACGAGSAAEMWEGYFEGLKISVAISIPCTVGAVVYDKLTTRLAATERERQGALVAATEARLASLESRVRPHFLFNALNSAIALIPEDPARAEDVLVRLSALLRCSLDAQARVVPLRDELRMVVDYLEIERVRFGERLAYELDVDEAARNIAVPVFAIQTLVENCVKYAVGARGEGARIVVRARVEGGRLALAVVDDGPGFAREVWVPGHGLDGLRTRLDALYGAGARIDVGPASMSGGAAVTIEVPA